MTTTPPDEWFRLLASWSQELLSTTQRIHYLIGDRHKPTKGSYHEALLRRILRRVLPDRFRVSTGFIYRWGEDPSRQIDILIWDAQQYSALLEEEELVVLTPDSVAAIIEVKSTLTTRDLRSALDLLNPYWWINWRYRAEDSLTGLPQQTDPVPFRAIFAYDAQRTGADATASFVFSELASFYKQQFGEDAERAIKHSGNNLEWSNMIDTVCIANGPQIEQTHVKVDCDDGDSYDEPGFASYAEHPTGENISVGRFCMYLLQSLAGWPASEAAHVTLRSPAPITTPGVCCFGQISATSKRLRIWGQDVHPSTLWYPNPPLWKATPSAKVT